jgi:nicotinamidase-related amidase
MRYGVLCLVGRLVISVWPGGFDSSTDRSSFMPVTALDERPALVVVDLQRGTTGNPIAHPVADVVDNAVRLTGAFRKRGLPVVLAAFDLDAAAPGRSELGGRPDAVPADFADLIPELSAAGTDILLVRQAWSCFTATPLHALLQEAGVTQVVIAGLATSFGVESTARTAYDLGYNVVLAVDAMTDPRAEAHDNSVTRVFPVIGETGTTDAILDLI